MKTKILFLSLLAVTSCGGKTSNSLERISVAPNTVMCNREGNGLCLQLKSSEHEVYGKLSGKLIGFEHEIGYSYELIIDRPFESFSETYTVIEVVSRKEDEIGSDYEYYLNNLSDVTKKSGDRYKFFEYNFRCSEETTSCDELIEFLSSAPAEASVEVHFKYAGDSTLILDGGGYIL